MDKLNLYRMNILLIRLLLFIAHQILFFEVRNYPNVNSMEHGHRKFLNVKVRFCFS